MHKNNMMAMMTSKRAQLCTLKQAKKSPLRERAESNSCEEVEETGAMMPHRSIIIQLHVVMIEIRSRYIWAMPASPVPALGHAYARLPPRTGHLDKESMQKHIGWGARDDRIACLPSVSGMVPTAGRYPLCGWRAKKSPLRERAESNSCEEVEETDA